MHWADDDDLWLALAPRMRAPEALERADHEVARIIETVELPPGSRVLDLGAGPGGHALAFARRGHDVTAVDRTANYLTHIASSARRHGVEVEVVRRDLRDFRRSDAFDLVMCSNSLGLLESDEEDARVLLNAAHSLAPGGHLLVRTRGKEAVLAEPPHKDWTWLRPGVLLLEEFTVDEDVHWLSNRMAVVESGRLRKFETRERLYAGTELRQLILAAGFSHCVLAGSLNGAPLSHHPSELVAFATK